MNYSGQERARLVNNQTLCTTSSEGNFYSKTFSYGGRTWCVIVTIENSETETSSTYYLWFLVVLLVSGLIIGCLLCVGLHKVLQTSLLQHALDEEDFKRRTAEESNANKRAFLSYVFHEVRVPFNLVYMSAEWLLSKCQAFDKEHKYCLHSIN